MQAYRMGTVLYIAKRTFGMWRTSLLSAVMNVDVHGSDVKVVFFM